MFRILYDPYSGSVERAWLKLLVIFCVRSRCLAAWCFGPVVCVPGATSRTRHTHNTFTQCTVHTPYRSQYAAIALTTPCTSFTQILLTKRVIFSQALTLAPWRWFLCKPKHVGAFLSNLECYYLSQIITDYATRNLAHVLFAAFIMYGKRSES